MDLIVCNLLGFCNNTATTSSINQFNYHITRNTRKQSKINYLCRPQKIAIQPILLPLPLAPGKTVEEQTSDYCVTQNDESKEEDISQAFQLVRLGVPRVTFERGCYTIQLQPRQAIPWIIKKYIEESKYKGSTTSRDCGIRISSLTDHAAHNLDLLRELIIAQHLQQLLQLSPDPVCGYENSIEDLISSCMTSSPIRSVRHDGCLEGILLSSPHAEPAGEGEWKIYFGESLNIQGNSLDEWRLVRDSNMYHQLSSVLSSVNRGKEVIYHIVNSSRSYQHHVMVAILNILTKDQTQAAHRIIEVGGAKLSPSGSTLADYVQSRRSYLKLSSEEKYGSVIHEQGFWTDRISDLTLTSIKFELLSRSPKQTATMKTDISNNSDVKVGSFVMYNSSRLSTLFKHFEGQVAEGVYPPLYSVDETDFSLLKTEDEWILVFHYVNVYPVLIKELKNCLEVTGLSQIVKFLHSLSRDLSTYYSRTHILGENRPHLIPTMMARLQLLKLIQEILIDGLSMLSVKPYDSM